MQQQNKTKKEHYHAHSNILLISSFIAMLCNISVFIINIQLKKIEKKRQNDKNSSAIHILPTAT